MKTYHFVKTMELHQYVQATNEADARKIAADPPYPPAQVGDGSSYRVVQILDDHDNVIGQPVMDFATGERWEGVR